MLRYMMLAAVLVVSTPAPADDGKKFYAGLAAGSANTQDFCDGAAEIGFSCDDSSSAFRIFGGFQVSRAMSLELGYVDLGKVGGSSGATNISLLTDGFDVSALFGLPIGNKVTLYTRLGLYHLTDRIRSTLGPDESNSSTNATFGAGVRLNLSERTALRVDWQRYASVGDSTTGKSDIDVVSVAGLLRF